MPEEATTKRARRKLGANPSQLWPQMPKIATPAARAKAYLRVAGLSTSLKGATLDPVLDLNAPEIKFGRLLAAPEERVRHAAVRRLNQYLTERCLINDNSVGLSELDLLKLWKGLWYTLYMADRVPVQEELAKKLAELLWCVAGNEEEDEYAGKAYLDMYGDDSEEEDGYEVVMEEISNTLENPNNGSESENADDEDSMEMMSEKDENEGDRECSDEDEGETDDIVIPHCRGAHLAALMVKTFLQTIRREWGRMDKYRIDKFYTVIRLMIGQVYKYMAKRHWNLGIVRLFNDTIYEQVLSQVPNGLRFHLIDISLEELANANAEAPMPLTEATLLDVIEPYTMLSQSCDDKIVQARVVEKIFKGFLDKYCVICDLALQENEEESEKRLIMDQVHIGTVADFTFKLASHSATMDEYRDSLYETFKEYKRRLKQIGKDVSLEHNDTEERFDNESEDFDDNNEVRTVLVDDPMNLSGQNLETIVDEEDVVEKDKKQSMKRRMKGDITQENEEDTTVKKHKRKKEKISKAFEAGPDEEKTGNEIKKNKRKKKKKSKVDTNQDEVINISLMEQQRAKEAALETTKVSEVEETQTNTKKKDKKKKKKKKVDDNIGTKRRVSFGKVNHSKSHKASMKALKTMSKPKLENVTPEKSILRGKNTNTLSSEGKKGRKRAVDYF
eukprot:CAMPEP_0194204750 /NCGR_PEP_ID=MMETSP0156-20130528/4191_1 /TAXON_ID=33649 /ORGANISM="Thalassionema nitzschioides, Strain L26-B" /LENGTH=672 /DNA_ID=CAMNT_0038930843 /DNA_START=41 /DNA_END=2059 /DNA_ORIENTATION=-